MCNVCRKMFITRVASLAHVATHIVCNFEPKAILVNAQTLEPVPETKTPKKRNMPEEEESSDDEEQDEEDDGDEDDKVRDSGSEQGAEDSDESAEESSESTRKSQESNKTKKIITNETVTRLRRKYLKIAVSSAKTFEQPDHSESRRKKIHGLDSRATPPSRKSDKILVKKVTEEKDVQEGRPDQKIDSKKDSSKQELSKRTIMVRSITKKEEKDSSFENVRIVEPAASAQPQESSYSTEKMTVVEDKSVPNDRKKTPSHPHREDNRNDTEDKGDESNKPSKTDLGKSSALQACESQSQTPDVKAMNARSASLSSDSCKDVPSTSSREHEICDRLNPASVSVNEKSMSKKDLKTSMEGNSSKSTALLSADDIPVKKEMECDSPDSGETPRLAKEDADSRKCVTKTVSEPEHSSGRILESKETTSIKQEQTGDDYEVKESANTKTVKTEIDVVKEEIDEASDTDTKSNARENIDAGKKIVVEKDRIEKEREIVSSDVAGNMSSASKENVSAVPSAKNVSAEDENTDVEIDIKEHSLDEEHDHDSSQAPQAERSSSQVMKHHHDTSKAPQAERSSSQVMKHHHDTSKAPQAERSSSQVMKHHHDGPLASQAGWSSSQVMKHGHDSSPASQAERSSSQVMKHHHDSSLPPQAEQASLQVVKRDQDSSQASQAERAASQVKKHHHDSSLSSKAERASSQVMKHHHDGSQASKAEQSSLQGMKHGHDSSLASQAERSSSQVMKHHHDSPLASQAERSSSQVMPPKPSVSRSSLQVMKHHHDSSLASQAERSSLQLMKHGHDSSLASQAERSSSQVMPAKPPIARSSSQVMKHHHDSSQAPQAERSSSSQVMKHHHDSPLASQAERSSSQVTPPKPSVSRSSSQVMKHHHDSSPASQAERSSSQVMKHGHDSSLASQAERSSSQVMPAKPPVSRSSSQVMKHHHDSSQAPQAERSPSQVMKHHHDSSLASQAERSSSQVMPAKPPVSRSSSQVMKHHHDSSLASQAERSSSQVMPAKPPVSRSSSQVMKHHHDSSQAPQAERSPSQVMKHHHDSPLALQAGWSSSQVTPPKPSVSRSSSQVMKHHHDSSLASQAERSSSQVMPPKPSVSQATPKSSSAESSTLGVFKEHSTEPDTHKHSVISKITPTKCSTSLPLKHPIEAKTTQATSLTVVYPFSKIPQTKITTASTSSAIADMKSKLLPEDSSPTKPLPSTSSEDSDISQGNSKPKLTTVTHGSSVGKIPSVSSLDNPPDNPLRSPSSKIPGEAKPPEVKKESLLQVQPGVYSSSHTVQDFLSRSLKSMGETPLVKYYRTLPEPKAKPLTSGVPKAASTYAAQLQKYADDASFPSTSTTTTQDATALNPPAKSDSKNSIVFAVRRDGTVIGFPRKHFEELPTSPAPSSTVPPEVADSVQLAYRTTGPTIPTATQKIRTPSPSLVKVKKFSSVTDASSEDSTQTAEKLDAPSAESSMSSTSKVKSVYIKDGRKFFIPLSDKEYHDFCSEKSKSPSESSQVNEPPNKHGETSVNQEKTTNLPDDSSSVVDTSVPKTTTLVDSALPQVKTHDAQEKVNASFQKPVVKGCNLCPTQSKVLQSAVESSISTATALSEHATVPLPNKETNTSGPPGLIGGEKEIVSSLQKVPSEGTKPDKRCKIVKARETSNTVDGSETASLQQFLKEEAKDVTELMGQRFADKHKLLEKGSKKILEEGLQKPPVESEVEPKSMSEKMLQQPKNKLTLLENRTPILEKPKDPAEKEQIQKEPKSTPEKESQRPVEKLGLIPSTKMKMQRFYEAKSSSAGTYKKEEKVKLHYKSVKSDQESSDSKEPKEVKGTGCELDEKLQKGKSKQEPDSLVEKKQSVAPCSENTDNMSSRVVTNKTKLSTKSDPERSVSSSVNKCQKTTPEAVSVPVTLSSKVSAPCTISGRDTRVENSEKTSEAKSKIIEKKSETLASPQTTFEVFRQDKRESVCSFIKKVGSLSGRVTTGHKTSESNIVSSLPALADSSLNLAVKKRILKKEVWRKIIHAQTSCKSSTNNAETTSGSASDTVAGLFEVPEDSGFLEGDKRTEEKNPKEKQEKGKDYSTTYQPHNTVKRKLSTNDCKDDKRIKKSSSSASFSYSAPKEKKMASGISLQSLSTSQEAIGSYSEKPDSSQLSPISLQGDVVMSKDTQDQLDSLTTDVDRPGTTIDEASVIQSHASFGGLSYDYDLNE